MVDGGVAGAILVIVAFVVFIVWGKSSAGRTALKNAFGEPYPSKSKPAPRKKRTASTQTSTRRKPKKPSAP